MPADLNKTLGGVPLPNKPKLNDLADISRWIDALYDYLRRLIYKVGQNGVALPPVPDPTKDYVLAYDSSDHKVKWIETTTECVPP